jgi:Ca2+/Na+ antiporter
MIANGSELLMLVLNPGLVGGLILPVMGAVPDGAIVLFSGLGPDAQQQLKIGVGTLAGSTIMLLTVPWAACALLGRVDLIKGGTAANYHPKHGGAKLTVGGVFSSLTDTGVQTPVSLITAAKLMVLTSLSYLVIQGPAFVDQKLPQNQVAAAERGWAIAGCVASLAAFAAYSAYCVYSASALEAQAAHILRARANAVSSKVLSVFSLLEVEEQAAAEAGAEGAGDGAARSASERVLRALFDKHDTDKSGSLDASEVKAMLTGLGARFDKATLAAFMSNVGGSDNLIQFDEFETLIKQAKSRVLHGEADGALLSPSKLEVVSESELEESEEEEGEEEEEEEEEEDEAAGLSPFAIKVRAYSTLALGVALVTIFSDPMVGVLSTVGDRLNISAFYVSFIVTPFVSNASEMISSIMQATRKTPASIEVTYAQLLGAATMNNTFCLAIFLVIVVLRDLAWEFSSEVIAILAVEVAMLALMMSAKNGVMPLWKGLTALSLYPLSLLLVWVLENVAGWN